MKIGDLVYDWEARQLALIVKIDPIWVAPGGGYKTQWDYLVYNAEMGHYYVDDDEIEAVKDNPSPPHKRQI